MIDERIRKYGHRTFENWPHEEMVAYLLDCNMQHPRQLEDGNWICLHRLMYTLSVCVGVTPMTTFEYRWCFQDYAEAVGFHREAEHLKSIPTSTESLVGHRHHGKGALMMKFHPGTEFPRWDY